MPTAKVNYKINSENDFKNLKSGYDSDKGTHNIVKEKPKKNTTEHLNKNELCSFKKTILWNFWDALKSLFVYIQNKLLV